MFIWAVCPTTVEMDLTFVSVVRLYHSTLITRYYLVCGCVCVRVRMGPISLRVQKANK